MQKPCRIERAAMDGTNTVHVIQDKIMEPGALTVDQHNNRIYWADHQLKKIESADFYGGNREVLVDDNVHTVIGLAMFGPYLYWIDKQQEFIERINIDTGTGRIQIQKRLSQLSDILSVEGYSQAQIDAHPCSDKNGGCSHLCVAMDGGTRRCSCPDTLMLMRDEVTCAEPPTCGPEQFTCLSGTIDCIPAVWRCDGDAECKDESDEMNCPQCMQNQFRCKDGSCIKKSEVCDGKAQCPDKSDEQHCCHPGEFECRKSSLCIDRVKECDGVEDCSDGSDEECDVGPLGPRVQPPGESATAQYTVGIVVGLITVMFILIFVVFACRRKHHHVPLDNSPDIILVSKPLNPTPTPAAPTPPHTLSTRGKSSSTCLTMSTMPPVGVPLLYDRNHVTGASSSSSMATQYPKETLNPPPSPVTDRSACTGMGDLYYTSTSPSTVRSFRHYRPRYHRPHHTTPCSTDVCEDSEPYSSKRYYSPFLELGYDSDPFHPPPPTPRSHYLSDEMSCPPSPSTERSYFNPYPPPPSPVGTSDC